MTGLTTPTRRPAYDVVWLRMFWLMSTAALVVGAAIALAIGAAGSFDGFLVAAAALAAFGGWLLFLRHVVRHGSEARAIVLAGVGQYVLMVALMIVLPELSGVLLPALVLPVFLVVPYLRGRALTAFVLAAWTFSITYATLAHLHTMAAHDGLMYAAEDANAAAATAGGAEATNELADGVLIHIASMEADQRMMLIGWILILTSILALLRRYAQANDDARALVHDSLTGLPNRALFMDRLEQALRRGRRKARVTAVVFLDVDAFKAFNDTDGHAYGDAILQRVGARIASSTRVGDTTARVGGDEFAVLLDDLEDSTEAVTVAERLRRALAEPVTMAEGPVPVRVSLGLATSDVGGSAPDELLKHADDAMYRSKRAGSGDLVVYEPSMSVDSARRVAVKRSFQGIVERGELRLQFQPLVKIHVVGRDAHRSDARADADRAADGHRHTRASLQPPGAIVGVEALVRWEDPERGRQMPDGFVGLAEETGDIVPIGRWVLKEAVRQVVAWRDTTPAADLFVGINLSARQLAGGQLGTPSFDRDVGDVLRATGLDPAALVLEISEHMLVRDEPGITAVLERLRELGVVLALDDFGTGYSSLGSLKDLPVDMVKIDRSLLKDAAGRREDAAVLRAAVDVAVALDAEVVAEGIETIGQLRLLQAMRCELGQGYLFARPLDPDAMEDLLRSETKPWDRQLIADDAPVPSAPATRTAPGLSGAPAFGRPHP